MRWAASLEIFWQLWSPDSALAYSPNEPEPGDPYHAIDSPAAEPPRPVIPARTPKQATRRQAPLPSRARALEERLLFSVLTVLNSADSGAGSLRAEIAAARKGDAIVFAPGMAGQTITLTSGELLISRNLTITGPGAGELAIDGNHASRVLEVAKGTSVTLSGLTLRNGQAAVAGGVLNRGTLTLGGCAVSGNTAAGSNSVAGSGVGGGIDNYASLTISGSTLSNNSATSGGGIANGGTVTLTNSTLTGNSAGNDGGAINNAGTVTVSGSTLSGNSAAMEGGAIINGGTLAVSNSTLSNNSAATNGGGILNEGMLTIVGGARCPPTPPARAAASGPPAPAASRSPTAR